MTTSAPLGLDTDYYRYLCDNLGVALVAVDRDGHITFWNSAAARLFGATAESMMDTPVASVIPHDHRAAAEEAIREVIAGGDTREFEWQQRDAQGQRREQIVTIAPIVSRTGETMGASLCIRDITQRIAIQNKLNETRHMTSLGEMAGAVAHHFNNILGGVITSIDYANSCREGGVDQRFLKGIARSLAKATYLAKGLLAFAEGDRLANDWSDLTEVVYGVADEVESMIATRDIRFSLLLPRLPVRPVPRIPVATILRNIAQNAVEAMPDGGALTMEVVLDGDDAVVRISDTGVGISEEAMLRMFEPFWTTKGVLGDGITQAAGLGLPIAHGLAKMIGATISVTSEPGKGSSFFVRIPPGADPGATASSPGPDVQRDKGA